MLDQRARMIATALLIVMAMAALRVLVDIPLDKMVPLHFDAAGNPNGWAPAWFALLIIPLMALGALLMFALLPKVDPRGENLLRSRTAMQTIVLALLGLLAAIQLLLAAQALEIPLDVARTIAWMVGLMFVLTGNVMGKLRWNHTVGIRTRWTMADERVWDQTHRSAGRLFVAVGAFIATIPWWQALRGHEGAAIVTGTVLLAVLPILRSYQLWRRQYP